LVLSGGNFLAGGKKLNSVFGILSDIKNNSNDLNSQKDKYISNINSFM